MPATHPIELDVFSVREIAIAAGVAPAAVRDLLQAGEATAVRDFVAYRDAVQLVKLARGEESGTLRRRMFAARAADDPHGVAAHLISGALHAGMLVLLIAAAFSISPSATPSTPADPVRLVFLTTPGPGGGGGGGGRRQPEPPAAARLKGRDTISSPVSVTRAADPLETDEPVAPVVVTQPGSAVRAAAAEDATPPVTAAVVSAAAEEADVAGLASATDEITGSRGSGAVGGTGSGSGTGLGAGDGSGIGEGSIAGTGGGPYRPGSGVTPPVLQREVKPSYTEEARRRGITGDVLMEVVIRTDGTVGAVRVTRALGAGLDERAVEAVRLWQFLPARRHGTPVDVLVEIAVEFRLR